MIEELIEELNDERKELGIPKAEFVKIVTLVVEYQKSHSISEEDMMELIREAMGSYDQQSAGLKYFNRRKNAKECFIQALKTLGFDDDYTIGSK